MKTTATAKAMDSREHAAALVEGCFVFDSVQILRTGGPGRPRLMMGRDRIASEHIDEWRAAGINAFMHPAGVMDPDLHGGMLHTMNRWNAFIADHTDDLLRLDEPADFDRARTTGRIGIMLGSHHSECFRALEDIDLFCELGMRCCILVTFGQNRVGTAIDEPGGGGLTRFGRAVVARMNDVGMAVDVSHCNERTRLDAIDASSKPVLMSHANAAALCPNVRNVSDEVVKALAARGGVVGVMPLRMLLTSEEPTTVEHYVDHIEHLSNLVGPRHVGIGLETPVEGFDTLAPENQLPLPSYLCNPGRQRQLDLPELRHVRRIYTIAEAMVRRGFSDSDITGFLGGNFERVFREIL